MLKTILVGLGLAASLFLSAQDGVTCETPGAVVLDAKGQNLENPVKATNYTGGIIVKAQNYATRHYTLEELGSKMNLDALEPLRNEFNSQIKLDLRGVRVNMPPQGAVFKEYKSVKNYRSDKSVSKSYYTKKSAYRIEYESMGLYTAGSEFLEENGFNREEDSFFTSKKDQFSLEIEFEKYEGGTITNKNLRIHTYSGFIKMTDDYGKEIGVYEFKVEGISGGYGTGEYGFSNWGGRIILDDWKMGVTEALTSFLHSDFLKDALKSWQEKLDARNGYESLAMVSKSTGRKSIAESMECVITLESKDGHGSGCIVSDDGYVLTNYHVAFGSKDTLFAVLSTGEKFEVDIIREDPEADLALLKMKGDRVFKSLRVNENPNLKLGQPVAVIGTPANSALGQTVTKGIFSSERDAFGIKMYQTDAHVNPGNSGGALVDENGTLIGVVSSKAIGSVVEGVGFAISSEIIFSRLKLNY